MRRNGLLQHRSSPEPAFPRWLAWLAFIVSQLFRWRKELCKHAEASIAPFVPVEIGSSVPPRAVAEAPLTTTAPRRRKRHGIIEIDLGSGHRIRVDGDVDGDALRRVLEALVRR
jgi:transposase